MPDFLVIGAPKAGTTALHAALSEHPGLYMSATKEPKFFLSDGPPPTKGGPGDALTYREHVWRRADYEALFAPAPPGTLRGESTPLYLYDRAAMDRIRDTLPRARLIVIVRDPVERAHSNWAHLWSAGLEPVADFVRACGEEQRRIAAGWASFWHYTGLGRYGEELQYLFTLFPRGRVRAGGHPGPFLKILRRARPPVVIGRHHPPAEAHRGDPRALGIPAARRPAQRGAVPRPGQPVGTGRVLGGHLVGLERVGQRVARRPQVPLAAVSPGFSRAWFPVRASVTP